MQVDIDTRDNVAYITLVRKIDPFESDSQKIVDRNIILDFDKDGRLLGIELLDLKLLHPDLAEAGEVESHSR